MLLLLNDANGLVRLMPHNCRAKAAMGCQNYWWVLPMKTPFRAKRRNPYINSLYGCLNRRCAAGHVPLPLFFRTPKSSMPVQAGPAMAGALAPRKCRWRRVEAVAWLRVRRGLRKCLCFRIATPRCAGIVRPLRNGAGLITTIDLLGPRFTQFSR